MQQQQNNQQQAQQQQPHELLHRRELELALYLDISCQKHSQDSIKKFLQVCDWALTSVITMQEFSELYSMWYDTAVLSSNVWKFFVYELFTLVHHANLFLFLL